MSRVLFLAAVAALLFTWAAPDASAKKRTPPNHLAVTLATPVAAGTNFTLTAKALDATNHVITSYNGVAANFTDLSGSLTGGLTVFVNGIAKTTTAKIANAFHDDKITVTTSDSQTAKSSPFNVIDVLDHLTLTLIPPVRTATNFTMTAKAFDSGNNLLSGYNNPVAFTDLSGSLSPTPTTFTNGVATTSTAQIGTAWRSDKITVTATSDGKTKQSAAFNVLGPIDHLQVAVAGPINAGANFALSAKAYDSANNFLSTYSGPASFTDLSTTLTVPPTTFTNGVATTSTAQIPNAFHSDRISAQSGAANGQSSSFDVLGPLDHFDVSHPSSGFFATTTFTITAKARDVAGNFLPAYNGPATWFDSAGAIDPLAPQPFINGTSTTTNVSIGSAYTGDTITVQSGGRQGTSVLFDSTGAKLLKDINPGFADSNFSLGAPLVINGTMYFAADDGVHGVELWKSNGTTAGTVMVKDINPGKSSYPDWFANLNGTLYFAADDGTNGIELWKSNGTAAGTTMVADINPTGDGDPEELTVMNGVIYFSADDGTNGNELWATDGTTTAMVADINPTGSSFPAFFTPVNGTLYFDADDGTDGGELWKSDGTGPNTQLVKDIEPGPLSSTISELTNVNGTLFFQADDGTNGFELWKSDGTDATTTMVKDINPGGDSSPIDLTVLNGTLLFQADDGTNGFQLWTSNGTDPGTQLVKIINPFGDAFGGTAEFTVYNGNIYFKADDDTHGIELWRSNGTPAGTVLVKDFSPLDGFPSFFSVVAGKLYFAADNFFDGFELWRTDGSGPGTVEVKDIDTCGCGSLPHYITDVGGKALFFADDGIHGFELWRA